jgi:hypothetical protein
MLILAVSVCAAGSHGASPCTAHDAYLAIVIVLAAVLIFTLWWRLRRQ